MSTQIEQPVAQPTMEDLLARIAELEKQNVNARAKGTGLKVSEKTGVVSFYGIGVRPASFYAGQWTTILENAAALHAFLTTNIDSLSFKDDTQKADVKKRLAALKF